jgi:hypothetical protein
MSIDTERGLSGENHDPEDVQRGNGRVIVGGVIFGLVFIVCAFATLLTVGVPFGAHNEQASAPQSGDLHASSPPSAKQPSQQQIQQNQQQAQPHSGQPQARPPQQGQPSGG